MFVKWFSKPSPLFWTGFAITYMAWTGFWAGFNAAEHHYWPMALHLVLFFTIGPLILTNELRRKRMELLKLNIAVADFIEALNEQLEAEKVKTGKKGGKK